MEEPSRLHLPPFLPYRETITVRPCIFTCSCTSSWPHTGAHFPEVVRKCHAAGANKPLQRLKTCVPFVLLQASCIPFVSLFLFFILRHPFSLAEMRWLPLAVFAGEGLGIGRCWNLCGDDGLISTRKRGNGRGGGARAGAFEIWRNDSQEGDFKGCRQITVFYTTGDISAQARKTTLPFSSVI